MITDSKLNAFRKVFEEAMKDVAAKTGFSIDLGTIRFQENSFSATIKGLELGSSGSVEEAELANWKRYTTYAEKAFQEVFGKIITLDGKQFKITGWDANKRSYPIKAIEVKTGKNINIRASAIRDYLGLD